MNYSQLDTRDSQLITVKGELKMSEKEFSVKGTGVDIIEISRIEKAFKASGRFAQRIYTPKEIAFCGGTKPKWESLAVRFAAKEAVAKALGTGIGPFRWTEIEIIRGTDGRPEIMLHGNAKEAAGRRDIKSISLSLSHCKDYAVAFVVVC